MNSSFFSTASVSGLALAAMLTGACAHNMKSHHGSMSNNSGAERSPATAGAINRATPINCNSAPVFFSSGSDQLDPAAQARLDEVSSCLRTGSTRELVVTGRADPRGTSDENMSLGQRRAASVAQYLRDRGITSAQITVRSEGAAEATNDPALYPYERNANVVIQRRQ